MSEYPTFYLFYNNQSNVPCKDEKLLLFISDKMGGRAVGMKTPFNLNHFRPRLRQLMRKLQITSESGSYVLRKIRYRGIKGRTAYGMFEGFVYFMFDSNYIFIYLSFKIQLNPIRTRHWCPCRLFHVFYLYVVDKKVKLKDQYMILEQYRFELYLKFFFLHCVLYFVCGVKSSEF